MNAAGLTERALSDVSFETAAAAFEAGYRDYVVPIALTAAGLERRARAEDVDPGASRVLFEHDRPAGLLLLARRGRTSRIAALGLAPSLRGRGLGRRVLQSALTEASGRGDDRTLLEVITTNAPAIALYRSLGFAQARTLAGYRSTSQGGAVDAIQEIDPGAAPALLARFSDPGLPWQLQPACFASLAAPAEAFGLEGRAVALVDGSGTDVRLLTLAVDGPARRAGLGRRLLRALAARFAPRAVAMPAIAPEATAGPLFAAAGWQRTAISQYEMACLHAGGARVTS